MGGKVEKIYLKYFDAAKMRGKVDTLIRDKMNRLHVLHYYRLKEHHKSWKVKVWKERQIFFHFPDQKIDSKYLEFNFFRLWLHFFAIRGCLLRKCIKQILLHLSRQFFWDQFLHFLPLFPLQFVSFSYPNLIVRLSESYYCSVTLRVPPLGHTAWAPEGREGQSQVARKASN